MSLIYLATFEVTRPSNDTGSGQLEKQQSEIQQFEHKLARTGSTSGQIRQRLRCSAL